MLIVEEHVKILSERLRGIPVYPSVGNHERAPANLYINKFFLRETKSCSKHLFLFQISISRAR